MAATLRVRQARRHGGAELPARFPSLRVQTTDDRQRLSQPLPTQASRDRLNRAHRPGGVTAAMHVKGVGPMHSRVKARVIYLVAEMYRTLVTDLSISVTDGGRCGRPPLRPAR